MVTLQSIFVRIPWIRIIHMQTDQEMLRVGIHTVCFSCAHCGGSLFLSTPEKLLPPLSINELGKGEFGYAPLHGVRESFIELHERCNGG